MCIEREAKVYETCYGCAEKCISRIRELRFKNMHIFLNSDFENYHGWDPPKNQYFVNLDAPKKSHHVHVFLSQPNESTENGSFEYFVEKMFEITKKRITIHIPRSARRFAESIMRGRTNYNLSPDICSIIVEHDDVITIFRDADLTYQDTAVSQDSDWTYGEDDDSKGFCCLKMIYKPHYMAVGWDGMDILCVWDIPSPYTGKQNVFKFKKANISSLYGEMLADRTE